MLLLALVVVLAQVLILIVRVCASTGTIGVIITSTFAIAGTIAGASISVTAPLPEKVEQGSPHRVILTLVMTMARVMTIATVVMQYKGRG